MFATCQFSQKKNMESWQVDWIWKGRCSVYWSCAILCRSSSFLSVNATRQYSTHQINTTNMHNLQCNKCQWGNEKNNLNTLNFKSWHISRTSIKNTANWHKKVMTHTHFMGIRYFRRSDRINCHPVTNLPKATCSSRNLKGWRNVVGWGRLTGLNFAGKWYVGVDKKEHEHSVLDGVKRRDKVWFWPVDLVILYEFQQLSFIDSMNSSTTYTTALQVPSAWRCLFKTFHQGDSCCATVCYASSALVWIHSHNISNVHT